MKTISYEVHGGRMCCQVNSNPSHLGEWTGAKLHLSAQNKITKLLISVSSYNIPESYKNAIFKTIFYTEFWYNRLEIKINVQDLKEDTKPGEGEREYGIFLQLFIKEPIEISWAKSNFREAHGSTQLQERLKTSRKQEHQFTRTFKILNSFISEHLSFDLFTFDFFQLELPLVAPSIKLPFSCTQKFSSGF